MIMLNYKFFLILLFISISLFWKKMYICDFYSLTIDLITLLALIEKLIYINIFWSWLSLWVFCYYDCLHFCRLGFISLFNEKIQSTVVIWQNFFFVYLFENHALSKLWILGWIVIILKMRQKFLHYHKFSLFLIVLFILRIFKLLAI